MPESVGSIPPEVRSFVTLDLQGAGLPQLMDLLCMARVIAQTGAMGLWQKMSQCDFNVLREIMHIMLRQKQRKYPIFYDILCRIYFSKSAPCSIMIL